MLNKQVKSRKAKDVNMVSSSDFIHLPYTRDLTEGGIAYAFRSLPYTYNRMGGSPYNGLRRIVAGVAVELAFRRYLSEQNIPFDVKGRHRSLTRIVMMFRWVDEDVTSNLFSLAIETKSQR